MSAGWPGGATKNSRCEFATCNSGFAIRGFFAVRHTLGNGLSIPEEEKKETWLCPPDDKLVRYALSKQMTDLGVTVRRTREGWVWIDNLMFIVYGYKPPG